MIRNTQTFPLSLLGIAWGELLLSRYEYSSPLGLFYAVFVPKAGPKALVLAEDDFPDMAKYTKGIVRTCILLMYISPYPRSRGVAVIYIGLFRNTTPGCRRSPVGPAGNKNRRSCIPPSSGGLCGDSPKTLGRPVQNIRRLPLHVCQVRHRQLLRAVRVQHLGQSGTDWVLAQERCSMHSLT